MKYSTYILLIGSSSAAICNDDNTAAAYAHYIDQQVLYSAVQGNKTDEVQAYQDALLPLQTRVSALTDALEKAMKDGNTNTITVAQSNLTASQLQLDRLIKEEGNDVHHSVLVDVGLAESDFQKSKKAYMAAVDGCVPDEVVQHILDNLIRRLATMEAETGEVIDKDDYVEDDGSFVDRYYQRYDLKMVALQELKLKSGFHDMNDDQQYVFNAMVLAQVKAADEEINTFESERVQALKTLEGYDDMTDIQKQEFMARFYDELDDYKIRQDKQMMDDMMMRQDADYSGMGTDKKDKFDEKLNDINEDRKQVEQEWQGKMDDMRGDQEWSNMNNSQKQGKMGDLLDDKSRDLDRKDMYAMQDMREANDAGYFSTFNDKMTGSYDKQQDSYDMSRQANDAMWDGKRDEYKGEMDTAIWENMSRDDKRDYMSGFDMMRDTNDQIMWDDRKLDDEQRTEFNQYYWADGKREDLERIIDGQRENRGQERQNEVQEAASTIGQSCIPPRSYQRAAMEDDDDNSGREERNQPDQQFGWGGDDGMGNEIEEPMSASEDSSDSNSVLVVEEETQRRRQLEGESVEELIDTLAARVDTAFGIQDGDDLEDMMNSFGDTWGKNMWSQETYGGDRQRPDMDMTGPAGQQGPDGPMAQDGPRPTGGDQKGKGGKGDPSLFELDTFMGNMGMQGMMGKSGGTQKMSQEGQKETTQKPGQAGGCAENLCCGNTLYSGIWGDKFICQDQYAINHEGLRFQCILGAKNLAASAAGIAAAIYMSF